MNILPASKAAKQFALPAVFLFPIIIAPLAVRAVSVAVDLHAAHRAAPNHPVLARNQQLAFERNEGQKRGNEIGWKIPAPSRGFGVMSSLFR